MNEKELKKLLIAAAARYPEAHIPHQEHAFPPDFLSGLLQAQTAQSHPAAGEQEMITMKKTGSVHEKHKTIRVSKAGIAAVVAFCIGLNAALFWGIFQMKQERSSMPGSESSEQQNPDQPHMELEDAMPTGVTVKLINHTDTEIVLTDSYSVWQNGEKVADCNRTAFLPYVPEVETLPPHMDYQQYHLAYEQLPAGKYTLCSLAEDGISPGTFGSLEFEISAEYDEWVYVPQDCTGRTFDELAADLQEKGLRVEQQKAVCNTEGVSEGDVLGIGVAPYRTEQVDEHGIFGYYHYDGSGYWVPKGETVTVHVSSGPDHTPKPVPDVTGLDFETAKTQLLSMGFYIDKRSSYSDTVPEGHVIEASVNGRIVGQEAVEATPDDCVRVVMSLGKQIKTVLMPDLVGMNWETAKRTAEEKGILLAKEIDSVNGADAQAPGTVVMQHAEAGEEINAGSVVKVFVTGDESAHDVYMEFEVPADKTGLYYISVYDELHANIGNSAVFKLEGMQKRLWLYADCTEPETAAHAVLINAETGKEAVIGKYILHRDSAVCETDYEDIGEAFRQIENT